MNVQLLQPPLPFQQERKVHLYDQVPRDNMIKLEYTPED